MHKEKKYILYPGRIETGNLGDILINGLLIRELLKYGHVFIKGRPKQELLEFITENNPNSNNLTILNFNTGNALKYKIMVGWYLIRNYNFDFVFDTPGHIQEDKTPLKTTIKAILNLISIFIYRLFGIRSIKYSITLGPFNKFNQMIFRIISKSCALIAIRDSENYHSLKLANFANIEFVPDLAFLLADFPKSRIQTSKNKTNKITVSFRGSVSGKTLDPLYLTQIKDNLKRLLTQLKKTSQISEADLTYQVDCDREISESLLNKLKKEIPEMKFNFISNQLNLSAALQQYANSKYVVTNRLHVFLLAMMVGTKTFVITDIKKHKKLVSILKDLDLEQLIFPTGYYSETGIQYEMEKFKSISIKNSGFLKEHLKNLITG